MPITRHGSKRVRERLGIPKKAVARMAELALVEGKRHADFAGAMRRYMDGVFLEHKTANNMRVYAQHLFVFNGETLITAWQLPAKFRNSKAVLS